MPARKTCLVAPAFLAAAATVAGCGSSGPDDFTLVQKKPEIVQVDSGARGLSKGDQTHFEAQVDQDGKKAGIVVGELAVRGLPNKSGRPQYLQLNRSELIFQLEGGDILAVGLSGYPRAGWKLKAEEPAKRAIIGGTGKYAGVRGELVTTRNTDGTYEQQFNFSD